MYTGKLYEFEGKLLPVKTIAGIVELAPSTLYKYLNQGFSLYEAIDIGKKKSKVVFKNREKTNNRVAKKYLYKGNMYTIAEISSLEEISSEALYRRLNKGMKIEEAVEAIKQNISKKYPFGGLKSSIYKISILSGVPKYFLAQKLDSDKEYTEEEIEEILSSYQKDILMMGDMTLFQYCIKNQFNYNVIFYSIKKKGMSVEEAVFEYVQGGQRNSFPYTYSLGNILLLHFFIKESLNDRYISDRISKGDSPEKAIAAYIFLEGEPVVNKKRRNDLFTLYWNCGLEKMEGLSSEEQEWVYSKHLKIMNVLKEYHLYQIIPFLSLELSSEDRNSLLQNFHLTEKDLMECPEDLFDGFVERTPSTKEINPVFYTWRGNNQK